VIADLVPDDFTGNQEEIARLKQRIASRLGIFFRAQSFLRIFGRRRSLLPTGRYTAHSPGSCFSAGGIVLFISVFLFCHVSPYHGNYGGHLDYRRHG
jgi:hypothetical protein